MEEKTALGIEFPFKLKRPAIIHVPPRTPGLEYERAKTTPIKEIEMIECKNNIYYLTFSTANSRYVDIPVYVYIPNHFFNGQVLKKGIEITTKDADWLKVDKILGMDGTYLYIQDENGVEMRGKL